MVDQSDASLNRPVTDVPAFQRVRQRELSAGSGQSHSLAIRSSTARRRGNPRRDAGRLRDARFVEARTPPFSSDRRVAMDSAQRVQEYLPIEPPQRVLDDPAPSSPSVSGPL